MFLSVIVRLGEMIKKNNNERKTRLRASIHAGITMATESSSSDHTHVWSEEATRTVSINTSV